MNRNDKLDLIGLMSFIVIVAGLFLIMTIYENGKKAYLEDFCHEENYSALTDYTRTYFPYCLNNLTSSCDDRLYYKIECDGNILPYKLDLISKSKCVEWDKWNNCINHEKYYYVWSDK